MTSTEQQDTEQEEFMEIAMAPCESRFEIVSLHSAVAGGHKLNELDYINISTIHTLYVDVQVLKLPPLPLQVYPSLPHIYTYFSSVYICTI
jgi:hypothetical protein